MSLTLQVRERERLRSLRSQESVERCGSKLHQSLSAALHTWRRRSSRKQPWAMLPLQLRGFLPARVEDTPQTQDRSREVFQVRCSLCRSRMFCRFKGPFLDGLHLRAEKAIRLMSMRFEPVAERLDRISCKAMREAEVICFEVALIGHPSPSPMSMKRYSSIA